MHSLDIAPVHDIAWLFCRSLWLPPRVSWRRRWTLAVSRKRDLAAGTNGSRPGSKQLFSALGRLTGKCLCSMDKRKLFTLPRSRCYSAFFFTACFGPVSLHDIRTLLLSIARHAQTSKKGYKQLCHAVPYFFKRPHNEELPANSQFQNHCAGRVEIARIRFDWI